MGSLCHKEDQRPDEVLNAIQNNDGNFIFTKEDLLKRLTAVIFKQYNWTYLHLAVWVNKINIVQALLKIGADINIQDTNGDTPLHLALITNKRFLAKILLEKGAKVDIKNVEGVKAIELMNGDPLEFMKFRRTETEVEDLEGILDSKNTIK
ncbi:hypothetical protein SteCoe_11949 [Stentor coeruleus]|uniref:Uncharacterized protein n=1 Tax=Stentor coeruleus TaxID=5963 RepID=A0A1R2CC24_9CILI|nr:hypothetical protein SteCoe_11949 [Stentor coeruleus]